jgi:hypothetical protein
VPLPSSCFIHCLISGYTLHTQDKSRFQSQIDLKTPECPLNAESSIHYSMIEVPGRKTLPSGQLVRFTFESDVEQDGFVFCAIRVQSSI